VSRGLLSPRGGARALADVGERPPLVTGQRVGPARRRARRRRVLVRLARVGAAAVILLAGVGAAAGAARWVTTSPRFAVAAVEVRGASRVPETRILAAAGIVPGANLWTLDARQVVSRVEALPEIRRADLVRELPNRVRIVVEERRPFTLVHTGRLHWLDEDGYLLGEVARAVASPAPVITGLSEEEVTQMRTAPSSKARTAIALIRALLRSGSPLAEEISEIDMSRREGPVLYTVDGIEVRLGTEEWEERLARLEGVLAQMARQGTTVTGIDLRFRDQVVLTKGGRG
jgi:cell division protein FtsQ